MSTVRGRRSAPSADAPPRARTTGSILFVCAANVCRSPLMQYAFLAAAPERSDWRVSSAGVSARDGAPICELSLSLIPPPVRALAQEHRSVPLGDELLGADMVIVASRAERAELARRSPEARQRVFTLAEAVLLGRHAGQPPAQRAEEAHGIEQYARFLDAQRGKLVLPRTETRRRFPLSASRAHAFDIPDGHNDGRRAHAGALKRVRTDIAEFSEQLARFLSLGTG